MLLWWHWIVLGLLLSAVELVTPGGFYLIFFGVSAIIVGVLSAVLLEMPAWSEWLLFSVLSVVSVLFFRNPLLARLGFLSSQEPVDSLVGEIAVPVDDIAPDAVGRAELRGTSWAVRNASQTTLARGQRCLVDRVDGLLLWIRAE